MFVDFVVCDDNKRYYNEIRDIVYSVFANLKLEYQPNFIYFNDYNNKFIDFINNNKTKVIYIMDLEMPSESGFDMAKKIRKIDNGSVIIFLTSHQEAVGALFRARVNALTFISKLENYRNSLSLAIEESFNYVKPRKSFVLTEGSTIYTINYSDIIYITKDGRKTRIVTSNKEYSVYLSLAKIKAMLPACFVYSHRACIVNKKRIESYDTADKLITFDNGAEIDLISLNYKKDLMNV